MYRDIYKALNEQGIVKSAVILGGSYAGCRCIIEEEKCIPLSRAGGQKQPKWSLMEQALAGTKETGCCQIRGEEVFVEVYQKNPHLVILGGGHVSLPVVKIGKMLGFHVTVMDDREEFVSKERFPEADRLVLGGFEKLSEKIPCYSNAYYVVVTRGHAGDTLCALQILKRQYAYFGMIGSRTKVKLTREKLLQEGYTGEQTASIHAPIGLPIGGETPEEIAVSIMAEIVQVKNSRRTSGNDGAVRAAAEAGKPGVMMTIIRKTGSSPRGVGSKMFLGLDGKCAGSIGGGSVEYEAMKYAPHVTETQVREYHLNTQAKENIGMICGGRVEVLFERVEK